jgi:hypothetical protein
MSSPRIHHWLLGKTKPSVNARALRDERIDVIRGLALLMIFVNHIPGNPLSQTTLAAFTFHDAAEVFVLLAGYSAVLAYHRGFEGGLASGATPILRRVKTIYQTQVALALLLAALGLALASATGRAFYLNHLDLTDFAENPVGGIVGIVSLFFQPSYADILPMYVVLMGALPLVMVALARSPLVTLAASFGLYAFANLTTSNLPQIFDGAWFFNPLTWQLIFVVGAATAHATLTGVRLPRHIDGVILSLGIVAFAVAVKAPWTSLGLNGGYFTELGVNHLDFGKTWGHPARLMTLFALAYLIAALVSPDAAWLKGRVANHLQALGRVSLPAFALGTVLSFLGAAALVELGSSLPVVLMVNTTGIVMLLALPTLLNAYSSVRVRGEVRPVAASAPAARMRLA